MAYTEKRAQFDKDISYFFSKINFGASALDAKAITFMNELGSRIDELVEEKS